MAYPLKVKEYVTKRLVELPGTWDDKTKKIVKEVREKFDYAINISDGDALRKLVAYWEKNLRSDL